jgi:hypothetical protein
MIGFKITATSNTTFSYSNDTYWTEGDFWILDVMALVAKMPKGGAAGKSIGLKASSGVDAIEAAFHGLLNGYLRKLSNVGNQIAVIIGTPDLPWFNTGLFNFKNSGDEMVKQFMYGLTRSSELCNQAIGDQVLIQICKIICDFDNHIALYTPNTIGQLWIEIEF